MIVTKEMAAKYLIKRACYLIETGPEGDFMLSATSVNWKEGMELFEDYNECIAEIRRRQKERMNSGYCPRCNYKHAVQTDKDITYLDLLGDTKGGKSYQCKSCQSVWYKHPSSSIAMGYDAVLKDFLLEWAGRDMKPTPAMRSVLDKVGNISAEKEYDLYPVSVLFKGKKEFNPAIIRLETTPPSQYQFNKTGWHYLDSIQEIKLSSLAYPKEVGKHIMNILLDNKEWICVRSKQTKEIYTFEAHAGVFMPKELEGQDFELVTNKKDKFKAKNYYQPADRGGPDLWTMTETTAVTILGDKP